MSVLYNEIDPKAAAWLRELIQRGHIAPGDVDERSIEDLEPDYVARYTQFHAFAGIGVWPHALRRAGWDDERPVWTGSCPCQPFSAAGKGAGFADERHLWPAFHHLISVCRPPVVFGEQVASKDGLGWLDLVQADLEGTGYASGAVDLCAAGVGAPHIRQRLWWVAERLDDPAGARRLWPVGDAEGLARNETWLRLPSAGREADRMADAAGFGRLGRGPDETGAEPGAVERPDGLRALSLVEHASGDGRQQWRAEPSGRGAASGRGLGGLADPLGERGRSGELGREDAADAGFAGEAGGLAPTHDAERRPDATGGHDSLGTHTGRAQGASDLEGRGGDGRPGPVNGVWRDADWLYCRDGKWRPVESGSFPLAHGAPARVGRLRGYGNAIVAPAAQAFIEAYLCSVKDRESLRLMSGLEADVFG